MGKKKSKFEYLHITTHVAFWAFIALFFAAMYVSSLKRFIIPGMSLLLVSFLSEALYQLLTGFSDRKKIKREKESFTPLPQGEYVVTDTKTNKSVGRLSNKDIDFLRSCFLQQGMDDNNFYFLTEILDVFVKEEKPNPELTAFLMNAIRDKTEMELHWHRSTDHEA